MEGHQLDGRNKSTQILWTEGEIQSTVDDNFHPASPLWQAIFTKVGGNEHMLYQQPDVLRRGIKWLAEKLLRPEKP